jgi:hypothetical protein
LVTLFANILQNPQDVRARSDLKLMSSVVSFLTMLERDVQESNSQVRRMLSVCAEFERIAKVVLDKAERDVRGRGKKKQAEREKEKDRRDGAISAELERGKTLEQIQVETQAAYRKPVQTTSLRASMSRPGSVNAGSPASWSGSQAGSTYTGPGQQHLQDQPMRQATPQTTNGQWNPAPFAMPMANNGAPPHLGQVPPGMTTAAPTGDFTQTTFPENFNAPNMNEPMADFGMSNSYTSPTLNTLGSSFQQPFVPQDLWQMPMTLEWDWAEGLGMGSFTPGPMYNEQDGYLGQTGVGGMFANGHGAGGMGPMGGQGQGHDQGRNRG